jgi:hypothetical protein
MEFVNGFHFLVAGLLLWAVGLLFMMFARRKA